jgi:hypothetical protein
MNTESMITDIRYAMGQIRRLLPNGSVQTEDTCCRALDALERVETELSQADDGPEPVTPSMPLPSGYGTYDPPAAHEWTAEEILRQEG